MRALSVLTMLILLAGCQGGGRTPTTDVQIGPVTVKVPAEVVVRTSPPQLQQEGVASVVLVPPEGDDWRILLILYTEPKMTDDTRRQRTILSLLRKLREEGATVEPRVILRPGFARVDAYDSVERPGERIRKIHHVTLAGSNWAWDVSILYNDSLPWLESFLTSLAEAR